jgi:enolase
MSKIISIKALEILDSRGNPTISVTLYTESGISASATVPSGASTGEHEAVELRDNDPQRYQGKGVLKAVDHVNTLLSKELKGLNIFEQQHIDHRMLTIDGTENKSRLGANAMLGVSMAAARAAALELKQPLYRYLGGIQGSTLPIPMMNIINGGAHGDNDLDFQEFMIRPIGAPSLHDAIRWGAEIFHTLKKILKSKKLSTSVGDEGGFAPALSSDEEALELIMEAITTAGFEPGKEVTLALDCAASEFYDSNYIEKKKKLKGDSFLSRSSTEQIQYLTQLCQKYPIDSIEDGLDENDWEGWSELTQQLGNKIQIVGDDLFVTNCKFLERGIKSKAANSILIKVNQIGTVTETLQAIELAKSNEFTTVISHRSGETADTFIADLAVATNAGQIKTGSLSRTDRVSKYNRLLSIAEELGPNVLYGKKTITHRELVST